MGIKRLLLKLVVAVLVIIITNGEIININNINNNKINNYKENTQVIYVATNGSDESGKGTLSSPYLSLSRASQDLIPGSSIQMRGGVYHGIGASELVLNGELGSFITIEPYPGENPIIDGSNVNVPQYHGLFSLSKTSYVNVSGLEIRSSNGDGFDCYMCEYVVLHNCYIHQISTHAVVIEGDNIVIDSNEVAFAALNNTNDWFKNGGWPGTVMSWRKSDNSKSRNWTVTNNYIHDCWGEGIIGDFDGGLIQHNIIRDTFSVNLYLDGGLGASNILVDSNIMYSTNSTYFRNNYPASGIEMSSEMYPFPTFPVDNVVISNNLIVNTYYGFSYWHDSQNANVSSNTYHNIAFVYNVIWEPYGNAISIGNVPSSFDQPSGSFIWNNIISNGSCSIGNTNIWNFSHNNWVSGVPQVAADPNSFSSNPDFINPSIIAGASGFKLNPSSTSIGKGVPTDVMKTDFWGQVRSSTTPTVGLWEP